MKIIYIIYEFIKNNEFIILIIGNFDGLYIGY